MTTVVMPRLSDSMEEGTILRWCKAEGEPVRAGEELVEIETDKANMSYEADVAGTLVEILVPEGETRPVGEPIARIGDAADRRTEAVPKDEPAAPSPPPKQEAGRVKASPIARRMARDRGLELDRLRGSGPGGRILRADVEAADRPAVESAKGVVETVEPTKLQQTVARRMSEAKATAPHFYLTTEIDMTNAVAARAALRAGVGEEGVVPSFNDMVVKACAIALRATPKANGSYRDGRFELYSRVNVGIAVAAPGSLVVPTIFDADTKGLGRIAAETRALAAKVRDGSITPAELSGGTFTVSNLGMYGITEFDPVINLPQAAILGVGAIEPRLRRLDGEIVEAQAMKATISCDHRILYGAEGAEFLAQVRSLLEEPLRLAL